MLGLPIDLGPAVDANRPKQNKSSNYVAETGGAGHNTKNHEVREMNVDALSMASVASQKGGAQWPVRQAADTDITDASAVASFLEIARYWSVRHMGGASLYSGVDSLGAPFLVALENDGHQAELFRRDTFDTFELTTSADGQQRKNWADLGHA